LSLQATVQNQAVARAVAEYSIIEPGATLEELVARTGAPRLHLRAALSSEVTAGRVVLAPDGRYRLVASAFPPGVLAALRGFSTA
jgi:hypothetical protein